MGSSAAPRPDAVAAGTAVPAVVDVREASVSLAGRPVLHGIDLQVGAGEVVTLLGNNGSGKSTLIRAVVGLVPLAGGTIDVFGTPLATFREWGRIGYVPQRVTAASGVPATVQEVVSAGRLAGRGLLARFGAADRAAVQAALDVVGLRDLRGAGVARLSGGQQQRVLIARALTGQPELLILDEPMSGVDAASQTAIVTALQQLVTGGTSVLLVLHELGQLAPMIDRSVLLQDGRVTYDGPAPPEPAGHRDVDHDHAPRPESTFGLTGPPLDGRRR